jgi:hypothetical protein
MIVLPLIVVLAIIVGAFILQRKNRKVRGPDIYVGIYAGSEPNTLGYTNWHPNKDYLALCLISPTLRDDFDTDRPVRVVMHELMHALQLASDGRMTHDRPSGWYSADGDAKAPFAPIPDDEVAWILSTGTRRVVVGGNPDVWLTGWVNAACARINQAARAVVLRR